MSETADTIGGMTAEDTLEDLALVRGEAAIIESPRPSVGYRAAQAKDPSKRRKSLILLVL
jgi:hypothetical protein